MAIARDWTLEQGTGAFADEEYISLDDQSRLLIMDVLRSQMIAEVIQGSPNVGGVCKIMNG